MGCGLYLKTSLQSTIVRDFYTRIHQQNIPWREKEKAFIEFEDTFDWEINCSATCSGFDSRTEQIFLWSVLHICACESYVFKRTHEARFMPSVA